MGASLGRYDDECQDTKIQSFEVVLEDFGFSVKKIRIDYSDSF